MVVKYTLRTRQAEETRQLLIATARELFTERGFAATSIEEIIQRAGVAKGALYHHFSGKNDLFRAVYDTVQADAVAGVVAAALAVPEPWAAVRAGLSAFLDACLDPAFRRIVVLDSVGVLQQDVWDGGIEHNELPMLRTVLTPLVAANLLPGVGVEPLVHVTLGGLYGAALFIARSRQPRVARREVDAVLDALVAGLQSRVLGPDSGAGAGVGHEAQSGCRRVRVGIVGVGTPGARAVGPQDEEGMARDEQVAAVGRPRDELPDLGRHAALVRAVGVHDPDVVVLTRFARAPAVLVVG